MSTAPRISVVIPCYNEAKNIPALVARFVELQPRVDGLELILVENGSADDSAAVMARCFADTGAGRFARAVTVPKHRGYGHGIWTGLQAAEGEYLAWSHADMQCDPADILRAFEKLQAQPDPTRVIVKGRRHSRSPLATLQTVGMQLWAQLLLRQPLRDINGQPKVFHRSLLHHLPDPAMDLSFDLYVLYRALVAGWRIESVPVTFAKRLHGESRWAFSFRSRLRHTLATVRYVIGLSRQNR